MKLGLVTDIHEDVDHLEIALNRFEDERVDQVVVIGDVFSVGEPIEATCRMLAEANAIGVWGNHDYGLSSQPDADVRSRYSDNVIEFMTSLCPRLEFAGCHFIHIEPWLDPNELTDL